ncbi:MAG: helix-turn-helix domain-containing protein [bacterium]|nr:helix-turn-helix domain-containing protein [bacterium]
MTEENDLRLYTPQEAAVILKMNPQTVWKYIRCGKLRASKFGRIYRIRYVDIVKILNDTCIK